MAIDGKDNPPTIKLKKNDAYRIIPSKYPPINFFENMVDPAEMEIVYVIEGLTNDRLRAEVGDIHLIAEEDRICGPGSSVVMAAFTHIHKPSRFSNGSYGVYYAARSLNTAIAETQYHRARFLAFTNQEPGDIDMRVYHGKVIKPLHDIRGDNGYANLLDPDRYHHSQLFGEKLIEQGAWGILYPSVRHDGGECIAVFRPPAVSIPIQTQHLCYVWNGEKIVDVYEKRRLSSSV